MMIAPTVESLKESEIIIVPDRSLYKVPFAALTDKSGKYLFDDSQAHSVLQTITVRLVH